MLLRPKGKVGSRPPVLHISRSELRLRQAYLHSLQVQRSGSHDRELGSRSQSRVPELHVEPRRARVRLVLLRVQGLGLKNEVIGTLRSEKILRELSRLARQKLSYDDRLYDLYMDSAAMMDFILGVEDEFDITLNMRETSELKTVSDLVELVESKLK